MSDKLISLESVLKEIRRFKGYIDDDMIERFSIAFKRLPAVPQEMSAREFVMIQRRLCNKYNIGTTECTGCPLDGKGVCGKFHLDGALIDAVEQWAAAHPEKRRKTYAEDFFEKFPNAEPKYYDGRGKEQMIPIPCRQHCYGVVGQKCNGIGCSCSACWNEEMEDEDAEI